jgi:hypothetical protein
MSFSVMMPTGWPPLSNDHGADIKRQHPVDDRRYGI